jgi:hypothetical protein
MQNTTLHRQLVYLLPADTFMLAVKEKLCTELLESSPSRGDAAAAGRLSISAGEPTARAMRGV